MNDEIKRLQKEYEVDEDVAEQAQELIDEGLDEEEAIEIAEEL
jgi:ribosome recycling factor